jgi:hypothetical protein
MAKSEIILIEPDNVVRRDDAFNAYINNTQFAYTKWDVQMVCGVITVSKDKGHQFAEEVGVIVMSPEHAKAVSEALIKNIEAYEAEHGEITVPKDKPADVLATAVRAPRPKR